jgi:hypothetical protein
LPKNSFKKEPEIKKLYELVLSNKNLSYIEFQQYTDELSKLINKQQPSKEFLQKILELEKPLQNNESLFLSLLKKLTDILGIETLINRKLVPDIMSLMPILP